MLGVAEERKPGWHIDKGQVVAIQDARDIFHIGVEYLRTGESFGCSGFAEREAA